MKEFTVAMSVADFIPVILFTLSAILTHKAGLAELKLEKEK